MPHLAVIGAGPSGIFATAELLKHRDVRVDVFDRLPTPFGLVRYGVAPDHLKIKSVTAVLSKVLGDPRVRFHGNVEYGADLHADDLHECYDAAVFATGAPVARRLGVPGDELPGNYAAADLVSWYNGHPDSGRAFDTQATAVAVVGAGNVSLDIARVLLKGGAGLSSTDVPDDVLSALDADRAADTRIDVHIIVRRTAADAKFTPAELLELENLDDLDIIVDAADLENDGRHLHDTDRAAAQRVDFFHRLAEQHPRGATKRLFFRFLRSPVAINGAGRIESIRLRRNALDADGRLSGDRGTEELPVQAVIHSIGYFGQPLQGIAFDAERGVVPNVRGRVAPGVYVAGWIKRGPSGIIGSNKACAIETVEQVLAELAETQPQTAPPRTPVAALLRERGCRVVDWSGWAEIDAAEIALGRQRDRARTKISDRRRLVEIGATATRQAPAPACPQ